MDPRIADYLDGPLALRPGSLCAVAGLAPRAEGVAGYRDEAEHYTRVGSLVGGRLAHLPVQGPMVFGGGVLAWLFGMCDTEALTEALHAAAADDEIDAVLLDIDTPGGDTAGMADLVAACDELKAAGKRLVGVVHDAAYSAGYWLASQCDELCLTATAGVGSIGVFCVVDDSSAFYSETLKTTRHLVASTALKGVNVPGVGVTEPQLAAEGEPVAELHRQFVEAVARGRGVDEGTVQSWAESADAVGPQAVERGMADRVVTFRGLLAELTTPTTNQTTTTPNHGANPMTASKSAAAIKRAADNAAAKAEDDEQTPDVEARLAAMEEELEQLRDENAKLQGQVDAMGETDTGDEEEEAPASGLAAYRAAFAAAEIDWDDRAKAFAVDAIEDDLTPKAAARVFGRLAPAQPAKPAARAEASAADPVGAAGPKAANDSARDRFMAEVKRAQEGGMARGQAVAYVAKHHPQLHAEYLEEVNAR